MLNSLKTGSRWLPPLVLVLIVLGGTQAIAQNSPAVDEFESGDVLWTCLAAFLVFFMQAGFALVEAGFTRAKSACNIIMVLQD